MIGCLEMGGSQAMVMNLLRNIDRSKVMFDFIVDHPERKHYEEEARSMGAKIYTMPPFKGTNIKQLKREWDCFFDQHPEYKILHSHVRSYASIYFPIAKKHEVKTIIHSHSTSNGRGITAIVKRIMQYPLRYQADYLMTCSSKAGQWLYGKKACNKDNYIFLPNAINVEKYRFTLETADRYRRELGLDKKFVIGHVGRFHHAKNHTFLLNVFAKIADQRPDAMLLLIGDGELREEIEYKIKELRITDRVILTGNRDDIPQLMQAMDIFVFPSAWEGLPVTVVEAQASGLPCLISDRITTDVDLSALVKRLPIDSPDPWVNTILNTNCKRSDVSSEIKQAGFDVKDTAKRLTDFYITLGGNND